MGSCCSKKLEINNIEQLNPLHDDKSICKKCNISAMPFEIPSRDGTYILHMHYCKVCGDSWND